MPALLGACSAVNRAHACRGNAYKTEKVKWAVYRLCHPALESPCHGPLLHAVAVAWSLCPWRGLRVRGVVSVPVPWSPCLWHGLFARGMVSVSMAWSPWPCLASAASPLVFSPPTCRWVFSLLKICLQSESSCMAPATDIDCTDLTPCTKFPESPLRGDSRLIHIHKLPSRGHTLSSFPLSVYLRAVCPQGFCRADPWGTKG